MGLKLKLFNKLSNRERKTRSSLVFLQQKQILHLTETIIVWRTVYKSQVFMMFLLFCPGKLRRRQFYTQPLENGRILAQGSTFTYQDILDRLLGYTPDTVNGGADEMGFTLTDGVHTQAGRLEFTMDVRKSEGPHMTVNRGLQLPAGDTGGFHSVVCDVSMLSWTDNCTSHNVKCLKFDFTLRHLLDPSFVLSCIESNILLVVNNNIKTKKKINFLP